LRLRRSDAVLARAGREQLLAQAPNDVLIVNRWLGNQRRVLIMNLQNDELPVSRVLPSIRLRGSRTLLRSSPSGGSALPPGGAIVLAGEGNLAGLVESTT
jgi:hypothetical protein